MKKTTLALASMFACFISSSVFAAETGQFFGSVDFGKTSITNSNPGGQSFANPSAIQVGGGYHYSPFLSVEANYTGMGSTTLTAGLLAATAKNSALSVAAVGTYAIDDRFEVFGKLGLTRNTNKLSTLNGAASYNTTTTATGLMYGIGAQFNVNKQIGIRAQYENFGDFKYTNGAGNPWNVKTSLISLGAVYNF